MIYSKNIAADAGILGTQLAAATIPQSKITENVLDGTVLKNTAASNVIGGIPVVHVFEIADAATANYDITLTHKTRIIDAVVVKTAANAGAANTVQIKNAGNAITDAIDANINDKVVKRAGEIDDAQYAISAGGTLRVAVTRAGGNAACQVYVYGLRVA